MDTGRKHERLVVLGAGMAAVRLAEELGELCPGKFEIVLVGREPRLPYNRVLLSSVLAGESAVGDIELRPSDWYGAAGLHLIGGVEATALRPARREVVLSTGARLAYDRLVLATGSEALRLPVPGQDLPGVTTFRDLADLEAMQSARPGSAAVVIGGGLLGVEAACGLAARGLRVSLLHIMPRLMERQLDARAAHLLKAAVESKGIEVVLEARTARIDGQAQAERVVLADGRAFPAELVVMAAGIRPNIALAEAGGLVTGRGVKVDDALQTSWPGIFAIGECAEHGGQCCGLVEPAYEQARVLARRLAGLPARYEASLPAASLKVSGVPVFSIGDFEGDGAEAILLEDAGAATYRKLVVRDGRLAGAVLFGDTADALWYRDLVAQRRPIAAMRAALAFGKAYAEAA